MSAPYKSANIPTYEPENQEDLYGKWMQTMQDTEGDRATLGAKKMDTLQSLLDKIPGYNDMKTSMSNMITQMSSGQVTDTHAAVLNQQESAIRQRHGMQPGSGAGANISLASFGKAGLQAQQRAMSMIPQFMNSSLQPFANVMNQAAQGPSWGEWGGQAQADHRDVYDSRIAQSNASYQADMLNTQYNIQKSAQAESQSRMNAANKAAQDRADSLSSIQISNQTAMQNSANYAAGMNSGMLNPMRQPGYQRSSSSWLRS
jgi:hypothetical protein